MTKHDELKGRADYARKMLDSGYQHDVKEIASCKRDIEFYDLFTRSERDKKSSFRAGCIHMEKKLRGNYEKGANDGEVLGRVMESGDYMEEGFDWTKVPKRKAKRFAKKK